MSEPLAAAARRHVLVVDGDPSFGGSLERDFNSSGFDVERVDTPADAIYRVAETPPDLVVLDLDLPDGAALKLLRLWKGQAPALVVILVSGNAPFRVVVDALSEGAREFFTKPVSVAAILDELEERRNAQQPYLSPLVAVNHHLGSAALSAEGIDRFFAISPGLLCVAGFDGYFKMLNPAWEAALGYSIDELCSKPYIDLVHPEDREKAMDEALEICGGRTVFRFQNRYRCKDGSYRWLRWSATPSRAHRLIYASVRDVTKSVRMEQGLRESNERLKKIVADGELMLRRCSARNHTLASANHTLVDENDTLVELGRLKDEGSAMIVHDLKNPLSVIVANYDYILEGFEGSAACLEALQDSKRAGLRMLRLLANLVDVARLEHGILVLRPSEVTVAQLLQPIAEQRRVLARSRQIEIVLLPFPELTISIDIDLVTRTIENIFDNALRHTPNGGRIEIELGEVRGDVVIRIGNSGRAIPVAARTKIFDKYRQPMVDVGRMNLGLGLYFCRLAIESLGGRIWVEETEQLPTVFCLRLPRQAVGDTAAPFTDAVSAAG